MIKVGGSLCDPDLLPRLAAAAGEISHNYRVTIIPGGGPFANLVRDWDGRLHWSGSASHWMAVAAMDQYGMLLESQGLGVAVDDAAMLFAPGDAARIFLPYRFLRATDPLPHSWSVTSDSIAAYLASFFGVRRLILLKARDAPVSPCPARMAVESGMVDACFARYLGQETECWIVNGNDPRRLLDLQTSGTRVIPQPAT
jgi:aspartokinase-like uncharacterized kinase